MEFMGTAWVQNDSKGGLLKIEFRIGKLIREVDYDSGESLLDAAIRAGLNPPYSCMEGMCSACLAKVVEGKVFFPEDTVLDESEVAKGLVLTCQAIVKETQDKIVVEYPGL